MTNWDFACSEPVDINIDRWTSGSIVVAGEPTDAIIVEVVPSRRSRNGDLLDEVEIEFEDHQLYVRGPREGAFRRNSGLDLTIKAPAGSSCAAKTVSADLSCVGAVSGLTLHTASGDLSAETVTGDVSVRSASGDVLLNTANADVTVHTASGDTTVTRIGGAARIHTASGDVALGYCAGPVTARTASGDVRLGAVVSGAIEVSSASGDAEVAVVPGIGVYLDLSSTTGSVRSELDEVNVDEGNEAMTAAVEIKVRTMSGDIRITRSRAERPGPVSEVPADVE